MFTNIADWHSNKAGTKRYHNHQTSEKAILISHLSQYILSLIGISHRRAMWDRGYDIRQPKKQYIKNMINTLHEDEHWTINSSKKTQFKTWRAGLSAHNANYYTNNSYQLCLYVFFYSADTIIVTSGSG